MSGWIEPPDPTVAAEYWITRRSADAEPGGDLGLPDFRACYRWVPESGAWITGYDLGIRGRAARMGLLHPANGWRIEGPAEDQSA